MSRGLLWFLGIIATLLSAVVLLFSFAKYYDGPIGIISGGPFTSGEIVTNVSDWRFLDDQFQTVEMQTMQPPRSRTMWLVVHDNRPYVVSPYMKTDAGKIWKKWPYELEKDNRGIIRADGQLYHFEMLRVDPNAEAVEPVTARLREKYPVNLTAEDIASGASWLFELKPAQAG